MQSSRLAGTGYTKRWSRCMCIQQRMSSPQCKLGLHYPNCQYFCYLNLGMSHIPLPPCTHGSLGKTGGAQRGQDCEKTCIAHRRESGSSVTKSGNVEKGLYSGYRGEKSWTASYMSPGSCESRFAGMGGDWTRRNDEQIGIHSFDPWRN